MRILLSACVPLLLTVACPAAESAPATGPDPALMELADNTWIYVDPRPYTRSSPTTRDENSPLRQETVKEPPFREYTCPVYGDGKIYYFGGGHSGYAGNDVEVYDPQRNTWRQCYPPHCPPKDDSTYYSGGSERAYVDPQTGACQPYVLHGYARTSYHAGLKRYVCNAMFPTKVEQDPRTGKWKLLSKAFSLVGFDEKTGRWELLAECPKLSGHWGLSQYDGELGGILGLAGGGVWLFKDGAWSSRGGAGADLSASGGAACVYLPAEKLHLVLVLGHRDAQAAGKLYLYDPAASKAREVTSVPAELSRRYARGSGGCNLVAACDTANKRVVFMTVGEDKKPEVWAWDAPGDKWEKLPASLGAPSLPDIFEPGTGRAPLMYDPAHNVFFLLFRKSDRAAMWAYRYKKVAGGGKQMAPEAAKALAALDGGVLSPEERARWAEMIEKDVRVRLREANRRDSAEWAKVRTKADWERFRDERRKALRASLGVFPDPPKPLGVEVTGRLEGDGHRVENLVFQSRPGLVVTANLYLPAAAPATAPAATPAAPAAAPAAGKMPGILICHSHHNPKTEGELQDMGVAWARLGCAVLVMDQLGHGERRQQPFGGRQDYRSRFYTGMQLHLVGDSLIGWMVWDLMRGVDLLLGRPGIDLQRIIAIGSVAGGGDPVAVAAAIDPRIACAVPFNFGGPQPETAYPLPADAEEAFNYAGWGSFESTRNLTNSARDGFLPWEIVAAVAPRGLIYAHEFAWDAPHDPVWRRLENVWGFYGAAGKLGSAHGFGNVNLRPPVASHCNNVGPAHLKEIYPYLERWFGIAAPKEQRPQRRTPAELTCLTDEARARFRPKPVHELARALAAERVAAARAALEPLSPADRRKKLRADWARLLGDVEPRGMPRATVRDKKPVPGATTERLLLQVEERIAVPAILLLPHPAAGGGKGPPLVVAVAEEGKDAFLKARAEEIAALLASGVAVCLPDLRGCGETNPGDDPGRHKKTTDLSSTDLMLGQTMLGSRLRDLRAVLRYLRSRADLDAARLALWGEAVSPVNDEPFEDQPESASKWPHEVRPLGGLAALLGALFEDDVRAVVVRRGLVAFQATLDAHFCYIPHDAIVPGALTAGDLCDLAAAVAPIPLRMEAMVDGRNCPVTEPDLRRRLDPTTKAYAAQPDRLVLSPTSGGELAAWLAAALR